MGIVTFEGVVEHGQIRLKADVRLPEKAGMVHSGPAEAEKLVDKLGHTSGWQARQFLSPRAPGYGRYSVDDEISCQADSR